MILPIYIYGSPVLRKTAANITPDYPGLQQFIADMWENDVRCRWGRACRTAGR